jgi:hypothetical protein
MPGQPENLSGSRDEKWALQTTRGVVYWAEDRRGKAPGADESQIFAVQATGRANSKQELTPFTYAGLFQRKELP